MNSPNIRSIYCSEPLQGSRIIQICTNQEANKRKSIVYKYLDVEHDVYGGYNDANLFYNEWFPLRKNDWDSYWIYKVKNKDYVHPNFFLE